jgi:hypothetical protein
MPKNKKTSFKWDDKKIKSARKAFAKALKGLSAFEQEVIVHKLKIDIGLEKAPRYIPIEETLAKKPRQRK